jgi:molecular chaperone HtpG
MTGDDRSTLEHSPSLEAFRERGWDVLLLTDPIDEFVFPMLTEYKGKTLKAADRNAPELPLEDQQKVEQATTTFKPLLALLGEKLPNLKEVRISKRLKESAACLVADEGAMGAHMERLMQKLGKAEGGPAPRILELNPEHPAVQHLLQLHAADPGDPRIENHGRLLHDQAVLTEGSRLADPSDFVRRLNDLLIKDSGN